jgi:tetratricopeptide (TPR) repeat protein
VVASFQKFRLKQQTMPAFCALPPRLLTAALLAIAVFVHPAHAAEKEPQWIRLNSGHFSVLTDAGEKKGREVIVRFEQMRAVFAQLLMKTRVNMSEPLEIIGLKGDKEFAQVAPIRQGQLVNKPSFFLPGEDRTYIVLNLFEDESWRAISHEFAHWLLNYNYPPTPGWFDEGFAEYFSSLELDNKQARMGGDPELKLSWEKDLVGNQREILNPPRSLTDLLGGPVWLAMPDLFTMKHDVSAYQEGTHHTLFYAQSWIVVHYLLNKNKLPETGKYFDLVQNQKLPVEEAVQQAYGMSVAQFEQAVKDYFHSLAPLFLAQDAAKLRDTIDPGGQMYQLSATVSSDDVGSSVVPVTPPEAAALQAEMAVRLPEHREQAVKELNAIVNQPKLENAIAHRALAWTHLQKKEFEPATEELTRASELDPRDPWVRYYLALVKYHAAQSSGREVHGLSNMIQDLRAVLDWNPNFAEAYNMLAIARLEGGGVNSAMGSIRQAIQLSPRNENYLLNLAQIEMAGKKWDDATALLERLKGSQNPQIARVARKNLNDLPTLKKYGLLPQAEATPQVAETKPAAAAQNPEAEDDSAQEHPAAAPAEPLPDQRRVQFLKGKLLKVDCAQTPAAVLTVAAGAKTLRLRAENFKALTLIGADAFSCDWKNRLVSVNYKAGGKADGDLVSLEVQ